MKRVERHIIKSTDPRWSAIDEASFKSKNIYNSALYRIRQAFIHEAKYLNYSQLEKQFKYKDLLPDQKLPMKVVQQVLMQVDDNWKSTFASLEAYNNNPSKFTGRPRLPKYKSKTTGRNKLVYTAQAISKPALKRGFVRLSDLDIEIKTQLNEVNQVRIVPRIGHYVVEIVYEVEATPAEVDPNLVMSLDLGVDTLVAITSNQPGFVPLLVNGRPLKSINHYYNQERARLQSALPEGQFTSKRIERLTHKRNQQVEHYLHVTSRRIVDMMRLCGIGTLVIGKNKGWKQQVNIGKRNNQNFVSIPHTRLIEMLSYKAEQYGIQVILIEESYTSKCSFLDFESVEKHEVYQGKRIHRGVFESCDGILIHADVNASYNIMRKAIPHVFDKGIRGAVVHPVRATPA